jgi:hypothetical protein
MDLQARRRDIDAVWAVAAVNGLLNGLFLPFLTLPFHRFNLGVGFRVKYGTSHTP